jgi:TatD DNase family protein
MKLIDTHCHLNFPYFKDDIDETIRRALDADIEMVVVGTDYKSSKRGLEIANRYQNGVYVAVGLHPEALEDRTEEDNGNKAYLQAEAFNADIYQQLAKFPRVVAVGEIGLDYFRLKAGGAAGEDVKRKQRQVFWEQLEFALQLGLPAMIHCRQAHDDMLALLTEFKNKYRSLLPTERPWGVLHCFSGDENLAWHYFNLGLAISFTGLVTFSKNWDSLIRKMPDDRLLVETDAPFMTPEPYRGKRNEPFLVSLVAKRIADIRGVSLERVAAITTANAQKLFRLV